jgi:hypothetical protein
MPELKTGKKPARYLKSTKRFCDYRLSTSPVTVPSIFGHGNSFSEWGMLGNDKWGDCVFAGAGHETELLANLANGGVTGQEVVKVTEANALSDYAAVTGFNYTEATDKGTDVQEALEYRVKTGIVDANGNRHKIAAFVSIEPGNFQHILEAAYIFDAVGIGIQFPESAMDQFNEGKVWSVVKGAQIDGGHYIPVVGCPATGNLAFVTWAKRWVMTDAFFSEYCDEAYAYITEESLNAKTQKNWGGYDWAQLQADLKIV